MLLLTIIVFSSLCYFFAKRKIVFLTQHYGIKPRALPGYYGFNLAAWNFLISILVITLIWIYDRLGYVVNYAYAYLAVIAIFMSVLIFILASLKGRFRAQIHCENLFKWALHIAALLSVVVTLAILFTIVFEAVKFFNIIPNQ